MPGSSIFSFESFRARGAFTLCAGLAKKRLVESLHKVKYTYAMSTQLQWSSTRQKAALALAEGQSQQVVAEAIGVCRKTICNWLCVTAFAAEVDRLSCMIDIASRAERLRIAMRAVKAKTKDGIPQSDKDVLDWLKFAQSETTGIKLGFSKGEVAEMDAQIDAAWRESVEAEVNRRLAERGITLEVQQADMGQQQIRDGRNVHSPYSRQSN
jgi:hypothetical protein